MYRRLPLLTLTLWLLLPRVYAQSPSALPAPGQWDGHTESAKLDGPYEDMTQTPPPFGIMSYYSQPWRAYMDTWPASKWLGLPGAGWGSDPKYADALAHLVDYRF